MQDGTSYPGVLGWCVLKRIDAALRNLGSLNKYLLLILSEVILVGNLTYLQMDSQYIGSATPYIWTSHTKGCVCSCWWLNSSFFFHFLFVQPWWPPPSKKSSELSLPWALVVNLDGDWWYLVLPFKEFASYPLLSICIYVRVRVFGVNFPAFASTAGFEPIYLEHLFGVYSVWF